METATVFRSSMSIGCKICNPPYVNFRPANGPVSLGFGSFSRDLHASLKVLQLIHGVRFVFLIVDKRICCSVTRRRDDL